MPVPVAARSKAWVYGRSPAEIVGSNSTGIWMTSSCECCLLSGRDPCDWLIHRPEETYRYGASECDGETSIMRRPCPTRGCSLIKNIFIFQNFKIRDNISVCFPFQYDYCLKI